MRLWHWMHTKPGEISQAPDKQDYERYNAYSQLLDRNTQWIGAADTKAGAILAFVVVIFPLLATPALSSVQKLASEAFTQTIHIWAYLSAAVFIALLVIFLVTTLLTLLQALMALSPRLTRPGKPGFIFFGDIARQEYTRWQQSLLTLDAHTLALQVLEQVYATAYIADRKHTHVRRAIHTLIITILTGLMLYVLSQFVS